ncbi:hypothetical protein [Chryseobacterium sp.]|uniref:hypothetical protein n=1 Tax=Chryseobacterium sp. TaxID=1871047 RepID=UPI0028965A23|nr:hypothetical protein [Chryseobacterium sp.]
MIVDNNKTVLNKNEIGNYHLTENSRVFYDNKLSEFVINKDTLTFFDQIEEIDEVSIDGDNKKQKVSTKKIKKRNKKIGAVALSPNIRTAFLIKFDASTKTFIQSINFLVNNIKEFDKNQGILKIQILENRSGFPDDSSLILEFEKKISDFDLSFNNYQLAKMKVKFPKKLKYPKNGLFIVLDYKAPKSKYILFEGDTDEIFWFYPQEREWKFADTTTGYYYTLDIIK